MSTLKDGRKIYTRRKVRENIQLCLEENSSSRGNQLARLHVKLRLWWLQVGAYFAPPPPSSQFLLVEQRLELQRPSSRHRWYCSLQFSSNRRLEIAKLSQAICGARWTADSSGEERAAEQDWNGVSESKREHGERGRRRNSFSPAEFLPSSGCTCELCAGRGRKSQQFIYRRMELAAICGVQSVSVHPDVPWRGEGSADGGARQTLKQKQNNNFNLIINRLLRCFSC